jgi:hypothetical protein
MQSTVARYYLAYLQVEFVPRIVGNLTPDFSQYQHARSDIPGLDAAFVVRVESACGHVAQVERGGAQPPHALRAHRELPKEFEGYRHFISIIRETGGQQRPYGIVCVRYS